MIYINETNTDLFMVDKKSDMNSLTHKRCGVKFQKNWYLTQHEVYYLQ